MGIQNIRDIRDLVTALEPLDCGPEYAMFFRGHSDKAFTLVPSIYRNKGWIANEDIIFRELLLRCPADIRHDESTIQLLVRMQHYLLPTRLLDISSNPLVALFFATMDDTHSSHDGEIVPFRLHKSNVKYFDSDTVSVVANISRRPKSFSVEPVGVSEEEFNRRDKIRLLLHEIRREKPHFLPCINSAHLESVLCVKPIMDNARIIRQDGAFFLFGITGNKMAHAKLPDAFIANRDSDLLIVPASCKRKIANQLALLGISRASLFPEIGEVAEYIRKTYFQT